MEGAISRRYAEALLLIARERGTVEQLDAEAKTLAELFVDRQLRAFFMTPTIAAERKKAALEKVLRGRVDPMLLNLAKLLVDNNRISYLPEIMRAFDRLTDQLGGVEEVTIISAVPLSETQREAIVGNLKRFAAYGDLRVNTQVDPAVLGGVMVKLGSQVVDGTVASRLDEMRQRLTGPRWKMA